MKKIALIFLLLFTASTAANAQKGMKGIGADLGVATDFGISRYEESWDFGGLVKFQYNLSNIVRIQPYVGIYYSDYDWDDDGYWYGGWADGTWVEDDPNTGFQAGADLNVFFVYPRRVRPYAVIGAGYTSSINSIFIKPGFGLNYRLSSSFSMDFQLLAPIYFPSDSDITSLFQFNVGFAYNF